MTDQERVVYVVNPAGAVHGVTVEHARERLAHPGWRMATKDEMAQLKAQNGHQTFDKPIAARWTPLPEGESESDGESAIEAEQAGGDEATPPKASLKRGKK